jgi:hypothetical protein
MVTKYSYSKDINTQKILEELRIGNSVVLIENFPESEEIYQAFIKHLGTSVKEIRNNNGQDIFDVKVNTQNGYFTSIANSNLTFPLHTDSADFVTIPNCIGLLCMEPASGDQGQSQFVFIEDILKELSAEALQELTTKQWNFRGQTRSILQEVSGEYKICYDRITMESFSKLSDDEKAYLSSLDRIFKKHILEFKLQKGDLILFRNDRLLHGRSKIDLDSKRLLKRIRFHIAC